MLEGVRATRYRFVSLAHHFLLSALPFQHPRSRAALVAFLTQATDCHLSHAEREAILLQMLSVIEPHTAGRLPSLVDRYLAAPGHRTDPLTVFADVLNDVIRYRGIGDREVQRAIAAIEQNYADPGWTAGAAAAQQHMSPAELSSRFGNATGVSWTNYRRGVRMDRAAALLLTSSSSIKEIWAAIGYNDGSNFTHDFRQRFGCSPRTYRQRRIRSADDETPIEEPTKGDTHRRNNVLIIEDDAGTRDTIARHLRLHAYTVRTAATAAEGLMALETQLVEAALIDYHLPDMTGLMCLREMRRRGNVGLAVAILTADWEVEDEAAGIRDMGGILASKLCDAEDIGRLVSSLLAMYPGLQP